jgi:hypothetical protein
MKKYERLASRVSSIKTMHRLQATAKKNLEEYERQVLTDAHGGGEQPVGMLGADPIKAADDDRSLESFYRGDGDFVDRCNFIWRPVNYADRET